MNEVEQMIAQIEQLLQSGDYKEAYSLVNKILLNFPDYGKALRLKQKIEKLVYTKNVEQVKGDLEKLEPLWEAKNYAELIKKLQQLQAYVPGYGPVEKQLFKAQKAYKKQSEQQVKNYYENSIKQINDFMKEQKYQDALILTQKLRKYYPQDEKLHSYAYKLKQLLIDQKIRENEHLLEGEDYDAILNFIKELQKIDEHSPKVKELFAKAQKKEKISIEMHKKEFEFKAFDQILILYQKKKYDKVIDALHQIINVDPENLRALELLDKAEKNFSGKLQKQVTIKIKNLQKKFRKQAQKSPKDFIKL